MSKSDSGSAGRMLAENVRSLREEKSWSQAELGRRLTDAGLKNFGQMTVSRIEKGERSVTVDEWLVIAEVLEEPAFMLLNSKVRRTVQNKLDEVEAKRDSVLKALEEWDEARVWLAIEADQVEEWGENPPFPAIVKGALSTNALDLVRKYLSDRVGEAKGEAASSDTYRRLRGLPDTDHRVLETYSEYTHSEEFTQWLDSVDKRAYDGVDTEA